VAIGGSDVTATATHRRNIGMVFQSHALFPHMTVAENVGFGLRMRGQSRSARAPDVERALELVRLGGFGARYPHQLSGGQQQRVALARALVFSPDVLLLDEPFGALDRKLRETMQVELRELVRSLGITAVFVTHDQEEALILSDRIAVMNAGRIEQIDAPGTIFERPDTRFVADFMGAGNVFEATVIGAAGSGITVATDGLTLTTDGFSGTIAIGDKLAVALRAERISLAPDGVAGINAVAAQIVSAVYQGALSTYEIRLDAPGARSLVVREASRADAAGTSRFTPGDRIIASWNANAVRLLKS
jgi:ABC-type Fe3+/spermidine/putrescine transport system ATPase subunit